MSKSDMRNGRLKLNRKTISQEILSEMDKDHRKNNNGMKKGNR